MTTRSRSDAGEEAAASVAAPDPTEVEAISRHLAGLAAHSGGTVTDRPELGVALVRTRGGGIGLNYAFAPRWPAGEWRARLAALETAMRAEGEWPSLLVAERVDRPIGLEGELPSAGWSLVSRETILWVGAASIVPHLDPSLRIEAVQPNAVEAHQQLETAVFGLGHHGLAARSHELRDALAGGRLRAYLVRVHGEPVAVARLSVGERDAALYGIGVAEAWRRRGMGTLLTTVATRAGLALGKRVVWLSVEDDNQPAWSMYQKLGFRPLFSWSRWASRER